MIIYVYIIYVFIYIYISLLFVDQTPLFAGHEKKNSMSMRFFHPGGFKCPPSLQKPEIQPFPSAPRSRRCPRGFSGKPSFVGRRKSCTNHSPNNTKKNVPRLSNIHDWLANQWLKSRPI